MEKSFYTTLKTELGASDAVNEYIEVLLRKFESEPLDEIGFQYYAQRFGIRVNDISTKEALSSIRRYYIVCVSQHFESFLKSFQNHLKEYAITHRSRSDGEALLTCICSAVLDLKNTETDEYLLYLLCDYYRLIRNHSAHIGNTTYLSDVFIKLNARKADIDRLFPRLSAPSVFEEISFDDFVLYSRAAKKLGSVLINKAEYNIDRIISDIDLRPFMKYKNDQLRLHSALINRVRSRYPMNDEQIALTVEKIEKII